MKTSYETKKELLKCLYLKKYNEWNCNFQDDRQLFCNMYEILAEALDDMKNIKNNYIWVGFNYKFAADRETMDNILKRF
jgi:hypothetical protein